MRGFRCANFSFLIEEIVECNIAKIVDKKPLKIAPKVIAAPKIPKSES